MQEEHKLYYLTIRKELISKRFLKEGGGGGRRRRKEKEEEQEEQA